MIAPFLCGFMKFITALCHLGGQVAADVRALQWPMPFFAPFPVFVRAPD